MGLQDVQVPRAGVWHWENQPSAHVEGVYELIGPDGEAKGTWWPFGNDAVPGIYGLLAELALTLQDREPGVCPLCRGEVLRNGLCSGCLRDGED